MIVRLYDGWNFYRVITETDMTSLAPRRLYQEMVETTGTLHIWCWDGKGARATRQKIFPEYKSGRKPPADDIYASILHFREILKHSTAYQIEIPGYEADDVIAALVDHYSPMARRVEIYSNDLDLMALTAGKPNVICGAKPKEGVKPEEIQVFKTFVGDPADSIPGVKGFGPKAWEAADKKVLAAIAESAVKGELREDLLSRMFRNEIRGEASIISWIKANQQQLAAMYTIVGFLPVDISLITQSIHRPIHNPQKVETMLKEFLL